MSKRADLHPALVETADAISAKWLESVFAGTGISAPPIDGVTSEPVGQGTTSQVLRLTPQYRGATGEAPASLILKMSRDGSSGYRPDPFRAGFEREVLAYRDFGASPPCRMPRLYWAQWRDDGAFNLLLEDLSGIEFAAGDQIAGCSLAQAEAVVRELGALHGWRPEGEVPGWAKSLAVSAPTIAGFYEKGAAAIRDRQAGEFDEAALDVIERAGPLVGPWLAAAANGRFLIHTDPRVDNIIFREGAGRTEAYLLDFQQMAAGDPAYDLAYFLTGSIDAALRRDTERAMVEMYAAMLDRPTAQAFERYRQHSIAGLVTTVAAAGGLELTPQVWALIVALARRNCAAVIELDGLAAAEGLIAGA